MIPVLFIPFSVCISKTDFFISGTCLLDQFEMDVVVIERLSRCFQKTQKVFPFLEDEVAVKHLSRSISGLSECRDCCKVFSTCSLNSSLKLNFFKSFPTEKFDEIYLICLFQQSVICPLSTTGKLQHRLFRQKHTDTLPKTF